MSTDSSKSR